MRSLFAVIAALWFGYHALSLVPWDADANDGALFAGLAFLALAIVDWAWIVRRDRELRGD